MPREEAKLIADAFHRLLGINTSSPIDPILWGLTGTDATETGYGQSTDYAGIHLAETLNRR